MTLSHPQVMQLLRERFVCGWRNIAGQEAYAGSSYRHEPGDKAIHVNNGAGHHNVQMLFLTPDGRVVHCLPGFWAPEDFLAEAKLALQLDDLQRGRLPRADRKRRFAELHRACAVRHSPATRAASQLQDFDIREFRERGWPLDFIRPSTPEVPGGLATLDQVVHERMAGRPFEPLALFDVASFVDLGAKRFGYRFGSARTSYSTDCCRMRKK